MLLSSSIFNAAILTVCVDPQTSEELIRKAETMPWLVVSADFRSYISEARRPYFDPQLKAAEGLIAVIDFDADPAEAVAATAYLQHIFTARISVAALSSSAEPERLLLAMRAGCSEFLRKQQGTAQFGEMLARLANQWSSAQQQPREGGAVLAFLGAKGGVGTTTLAVNLAVHLKQSPGKRVLLIDSHAALGHVCLYLGIDGSRYHFHEVVRNVSRLDSELLQGFVARHASGLDVLCSPDQPAGAQPMDAGSLARTLEFLRAEYDYIVVDCETAVTDTTVTLLDAATRVYLVAGPELGAIRDLSRYIEHFSVDATTEKVDVVMNRASARYGMDLANVEKAIRRPITLKLPNSYTDLVKPMNLGEPVSPTKDKSEFTQQLSKWAHSLTGDPLVKTQAKKEASIFSLWK